MKAILTSALGGSIKVNGERIPSVLMEKNGLLYKIKSMWTENAKVMLIHACPNSYDRNDSVYHCLREAFRMSGLSYSSFEACDDRNEEIMERLGEMDAIILGGGHVPTQNAFMKKLGLKEKIKDYNGLVIAWSAGSMNCAEIVYAAPELEGEATDPYYQRFISGLGLTKINIFPHFESLQDEILDGLRVIEDITYADSMGREILALNNGSYIVIEDGGETLYGEAYRIKDGCQTQICRDGESVGKEKLCTIVDL